MSQRLYLDRTSYEPEPAYYKDKNSKITEIEAYVNVLIDNNRAYADQLNALRRENTDLRGQIQVLMGDILRQRESSQQLLNNTKAQYSREVGKLIEELKDILNKKQQMEGSYKSLLEELSYQNEFDKRSRSIQIQEIQRNYESKLKILNDRLTQQSKEIEQNFYLHSDNKLRMVKEIDQLNYQNTELKKINKDLREAHLFDENEIQRLSLNVKQLSKEKEELGVNLLKVQQQKNNQLIQMKQTMAQLRQELNDQIDNVKKLEGMLFSKEKQYQLLSQKRDLQLKIKSQLEGNHIHQSHEINEKTNQVAELNNELNRLKDFSNRELKRMSDLIRMLENDSTKANKEKNDMENQLQIKQNEVVSLLNKLKKLEAENATMANTLIKIQQDNLQLKQMETVLKEDIDSLLLQLKNEQEKNRLQANRITTLQQIIEKQKKKNIQLQNNNNDREYVARQIPNELNKKYEVEIQQILRRSEYQKGEILQKCEKQKQKLIRMYQKALREKQTLFKQKIFLMQSEIRQLAST